MDAMIKKKLPLEKTNNDNYKYPVQVQQLHVRFNDDAKPKKKSRNKNFKSSPKSSPIKTVLKKDKKSVDDDELYVRIPLKKTKVMISDKKCRKKKEEPTIPEEESEHVSTALELQQISAQMDATQV